MTDISIQKRAEGLEFFSPRYQMEQKIFGGRQASNIPDA
jgi:hypothetical protein